MKTITSLDNKLIKLVSKLKEAKNRKKEKMFIVDGKRELILAKESNYNPKYVFVNEDLIDLSDEFINTLNGTEIILVSNNIFKNICYKENPDGYLSVFNYPESDNNSLFKEVKINNKPIIVLDRVEKPGNVGAIIRTMIAAGLNNLILSNCSFDIFNPNIIRSSEGLVFSVNYIYNQEEEILNHLKTKKIKIIGTATNSTKLYSDESISKNTALVFGSENKGLGDFWLNNADNLLKIPMINKNVDSLNVSVSAAILIYESARQNKFKGLE